MGDRKEREIVKMFNSAGAIVLVLFTASLATGNETAPEVAKTGAFSKSSAPRLTLTRNSSVGEEQPDETLLPGNEKLFSMMAEETGSGGTDTGDQPKPIPIYKPVLLSAVLPGGGQLYRGQKRGFAYIAAEVVTLSAWIFFRNEEDNNVQEYKDFARLYAREPIADHDPWFSLIQDRVNPNQQGDWDYYEHMANFRRSGRLDRDLNNDYTQSGDLKDLDPETEYTDSFNHRQWNIARINYFQPDPDSDDPDALIGSSADTLAAKEFYAKTSTPFSMAWDWGPPEQLGTANQNEYKRIIDDANSAARKAGFSLGMLLANHVVSTIDSYISVKTYNSKLGGKDGLGIHMDQKSMNDRGIRARIGLVRKF